MALLRDADVTLEVCPTSNVLRIGALGVDDARSANARGHAAAFARSTPVLRAS